MRKTILFSLTLLLGMSLSIDLNAQDKVRKSQKAVVTQFVGNDAEISIAYSRPAVNGRQVWGNIVPFGMEEGNQYSDNKPFPWRAGANENTTISFNKDVKIGGKSVPAGKYSVHMIPSENDAWVVIFNKDNENWGSYKYDQSKDVARINVEPQSAEFQELLTFGFENVKESATDAYLHWEELKVPFTIEIN